MDNVETLIPDFDALEELARQAAGVSASIVYTKNELSMLEANVIRTALTDKRYWIGGKQPSMSYCDSVVAELGNTEEDTSRLLELRNTLAELTEQSKLLKHIIGISKDKLELYRTISANERKGFL